MGQVTECILIYSEAILLVKFGKLKVAGIPKISVTVSLHSSATPTPEDDRCSKGSVLKFSKSQNWYAFVLDQKGRIDIGLAVVGNCNYHSLHFLGNFHLAP